MPKQKRHALSLHSDLYDALTAQALAHHCIIAHLLQELLEMGELAEMCERIEIYFGDRTTPAVVKVWMPVASPAERTADGV